MHVPVVTSEQSLADIERLQDDVLIRLEALNAQIEQLLAAEVMPFQGLASVLLTLDSLDSAT